MADELKPCIICGSKNKVISCGDNKQYYVVQCSKCTYSPVPLNCARITIKGAIKEFTKWNTRKGE